MKKPLFYTFIDSNKPDIIVVTETWLTTEMHDNEIFPPELGYTVYRRDRVDKREGGVIILVNSKITSVLRSEFNTNCEYLWVQLNLAVAKSVLIGAYYKPYEYDPESIASFEELKISLSLVNQTNSNVWLLVDFNLPKVDWENLIPSPDCNHQTFYSECLEVLDDCLLEQMVTSPTRGQNILDLFLTTIPTLVDNVFITPGLSDHDIVLTQVIVKPEVLKQVPRSIHLYKKADSDQLKQSIRDVCVELKQSDLATITVQSMWDKFPTGLEQGIDKFIPVRKAGTRDGFPWINQEIRRLIRKRDKLYKRWSRSGRPYDKAGL